MLHSPLTAIAAAVLLGAAGQVLASLSRMPAIVFLLALGVATGPYGLGLVQPAALGTGLPVLTSAFVAIILFEGGLTLRPGVLRHAIAPVRGLITVGAAVTLCGTALLSHWLVRLPWPQAFLFAAMVMVTGPTVIAPILRRVRLLPRLHAALKSESILVDPVGAIIAVVALEYLLAVGTRSQEHWMDVLLGLLYRGGVGILTGALAGLAAVAAGQLQFFHRYERGHLVNLGAVGLALGTYVVADRLQPESSILAVIVAGLVLAAGPIPYRKELERFKEHLATLGVSVLFILLAANLNLRLLADAGWREAALLLGLIFAVRPAAVLLSTVGTSLTWREKAYLSLVAPRGILAAAMASYFTDQLRARGIAGADRVEMLAFLVIGVTVCLQGSWAAVLARALRVRAEESQGVLLVGVNEWSLAVAEELRRLGRPALFLDNNPVHCEVAQDLGFEAHQGDATDGETYGDLDLSQVGALVAMTPNDAVNTLACDAAHAWLGAKHTLQVVSKPVGEAPRAGVRMGGRWAMPTRLPHRDIVRLLREGRLQVRAEPCREPTALTSKLTSSNGPLVPLFVLEGGRLDVAVQGRTCPAGADVVGLAPPGTAPEVNGAGKQLPTPDSLTRVSPGERSP